MSRLLADEHPGRAVRHLGRAFGLDLDVGFECPGLPGAADRVADPVRGGVVHVDTVETLSAMPSDAETLWVARDPDGRAGVQLTATPTAGHRFSTIAYGDFHISADALRVECAPADGAAWRWQRFLIGQILPFVAVLHGYEVFHASVVQLEHRTVAFTGPSHAGKSSLATALALTGGRHVTDDVMVVAADDPHESLHVHHGFGLVSVRHETVDRLGSIEVDRLGARVGSDGDAVRLLVDLAVEPTNLTDLFFLRRSAVPAPLIESIEPVDPRLLLGSGYNYVIRTPERLEQHLDVCARIARSTSCSQITIGPDRGPAEVAEAIRSHLASSGDRQ